MHPQIDHSPYTELNGILIKGSERKFKETFKKLQKKQCKDPTLLLQIDQLKSESLQKFNEMNMRSDDSTMDILTYNKDLEQKIFCLKQKIKIANNSTNSVVTKATQNVFEDFN